MLLLKTSDYFVLLLQVREIEWKEDKSKIYNNHNVSSTNFRQVQVISVAKILKTKAIGNQMKMAVDLHPDTSDALKVVNF